MTLWIEVGSQECLLVVIGSCLWRGIRKDCFSLHNGQSFTFWEDVYWKNDPLKVHLANIYQLIVFVGGLFLSMAGFLPGTFVSITISTVWSSRNVLNSSIAWRLVWWIKVLRTPCFGAFPSVGSSLSD